MELHDHGLASDLEMMRQVAERRQVLRWLLAGAATLPLMSCGGGSDAGNTAASSGAGTGSVMTPTTGACTVIPEETGGPYPADGTNTHGGSIINVLKQSGVVRSDIRSSFNGATGVAEGVPLSIKLQLLNASGSCASLAKAASASNRLKTSQFTFPMATLNEAYTASGYTASVRNLAQISYATDDVFSDGSSLQMATVTGNATQGYVVTLSIAVNG